MVLNEIICIVSKYNIGLDAARRPKAALLTLPATAFRRSAGKVCVKRNENQSRERGVANSTENAPKKRTEPKPTNRTRRRSVSQKGRLTLSKELDLRSFAAGEVAGLC